MSELFNALQKLEEKNASEEIPAPPPVSGDGGDGKRSRVPYSKALLLLFIVLLVTVAALAFLWFQPNLPFFSRTVQQQAVPSQDILPQSVEPLPLEVLPKDGVVPENSATEEHMGGKDGSEPGDNLEETANEIQNSGDNEPKKIGIAIAAEKQPQDTISSNQESVGSELEPQPIDIIHDIEGEREMVQRKRLMYRAEHLRIQGETNEALDLYKQAWNINPGPALANNMAALLISIEQYANAERYLQKGLQLTPDDKDLLFNLEIARQGKKQKK